MRDPSIVIHPCIDDSVNYDPQTIIKAQSLIRGFLIRLKFQKLVAKKLQRHKIAKELLETEISYVSGLELIMKLCLDRFKRERNNPDTLLTPEQTSSIFSNIRNIYEINNTLLTDLRKRVEDWKQKDAIGDIFMSWAPAFISYTIYCRNHDSAIAMLRQIRQQNPKFEAFLTEFQAETKQTLQTLLITPVQRIPRYILLLQQMSKYTSSDHFDYKDLSSSLVQLELITQKVNHGIEYGDSVNKVLDIQLQLSGVLHSGVSLVKPGRHFVRDGVVELCQLDKAHKQYSNWLILFNDALLFARIKNKDEKERTYSDTLLLLFENGIRLKDIQDMDFTKNMFFMITKEKTLIIHCSTAEAKLKWLEDINLQMSQFSENLKSLSQNPKTQDNNSISVSIMGTSTSMKKNKEYTNYMIKVTRQEGNSTKDTMVCHRYRDFDSLHKTLESSFPGKKFMELPSKHFIGNLQKDVIEYRRILLQGFLEEIVSDPALYSHPEVVHFLDLPPSYFDTDIASIASASSTSGAHLALPHLKAPRKNTLERLIGSVLKPQLKVSSEEKSPPGKRSDLSLTSSSLSPRAVSPSDCSSSLDSAAVLAPTYNLSAFNSSPPSPTPDRENDGRTAPKDINPLMASLKNKLAKEDAKKKTNRIQFSADSEEAEKTSVFHTLHRQRSRSLTNSAQNLGNPSPPPNSSISPLRGSRNYTVQEKRG